MQKFGSHVFNMTLTLCCGEELRFPVLEPRAAMLIGLERVFWDNFMANMCFSFMFGALIVHKRSYSIVPLFDIILFIILSGIVNVGAYDSSYTGEP